MNEQDKQNLRVRIEDALQAVRPHLYTDGGDIEVVDITDDLCVKIKWLGMCESCSMAPMTLQAGIAEAIRSKIPEISAVEAIN